jgi:hypothetical protein
MLFFSVFVHRAPPADQRALHAYHDMMMHGMQGADHALSKLAKITSCPLLICLWVMQTIQEHLAKWPHHQLCTENA